jgi:hypothetical protein
MSAQENNELTLEGIVERLEALERENAQLRQKVVTLEGSGTRSDEVAARRSSETSQAVEPASAFEGPVSRRSLLSKAGAAAVAAMAAGMLLNPREAKAGIDNFDTIWCDDLVAHETGVFSTHKGVGGTGVTGRGYTGVLGETDRTAGVHGKGGIGGFGVLGETRTGGAGVMGRGEFAPGVRGETSEIGVAGVEGKHLNAGFQAIGVLGTTNDGVGVLGLGKVGVRGKSDTLGHAAVYGEHTSGQGPGVVGDGTGWDAGVLGRSPDGDGVKGEGAIGVRGKATASYGYGGWFEGVGRAQLKLEPASTAGPPTTGSHQVGEIYLDARGSLFVFTSQGPTSPGTWRRIATMPT